MEKVKDIDESKPIDMKDGNIFNPYNAGGG